MFSVRPRKVSADCLPHLSLSWNIYLGNESQSKYGSTWLNARGDEAEGKAEAKGTAFAQPALEYQ
jgi:hypothetical protein